MIHFHQARMCVDVQETRPTIMEDASHLAPLRFVTGASDLGDCHLAPLRFATDVLRKGDSHLSYNDTPSDLYLF
jgi:hypothetical protein